MKLPENLFRVPSVDYSNSFQMESGNRKTKIADNTDLNEFLQPEALTRPSFAPLPYASYESLFDYNKFPVVKSLFKKNNPEPSEDGVAEEEDQGENLIRFGYNREFPLEFSDLDIEMWCAATRLSIEKGGLGEFGHLKRCVQLLFPYLENEWTHWLDMQLSMFCGYQATNCLLGGGGSGKSWALGTFSRIWQACNPTQRGVLIINTTQKTQADRAWKYAILTGQYFPWLPGELRGTDDPKIEILIERWSQKKKKMVFEPIPGVGLFSQTIKKGTSAQATADLKGFHPPEMIVIVEEANHHKKTHLERARANWISNQHCIVNLTGNPEIQDSMGQGAKVYDDALKHFSTPLHGWDSVTWGENRYWENKFGGRTFHLDPYDSPRIHNPEKYKVSTWLPTRATIKEKAAQLDGENGPLFNQQVRGIFDRDSLPFMIITKTMVRKFRAEEPARFIGFNRQRYAAFDPAYSGSDEAFLQIAETGITENGKTEIDFFGESGGFSFTLDKYSPKEPSFQMLDWVRDILTEHRIPYSNLVMDANLIGIGLGDIFSTFLSKDIYKIQAWGQPSDIVLDLNGRQTAKDRCASKQAEMWLALQLLIISGQIRGLGETTIKQLCDMPAERTNGKLSVLSKQDFRKNYGYSPDRAECALFIIDLLRTRGFSYQNALEGGTGREESVEMGFHGGMEIGQMRPEDLFQMAGPASFMSRGASDDRRVHLAAMGFGSGLGSRDIGGDNSRMETLDTNSLFHKFFGR